MFENIEQFILHSLTAVAYDPLAFTVLLFLL